MKTTIDAETKNTVIDYIQTGMIYIHIMIKLPIL